ncbi:MAG: phenylalanine--tRNA ligase subunit beta [Bacteroidales bacterium]|nr:MAG: phenylalanine--tRNA ligase subunit beta [Bacteroidales bacterium]
MKISYAWLKEYIGLDLDPKKTADILTDIGLEVEGMEEFESVRGGLEGVVIGEVISAERHPNADKLILTTVDTGQKENLQIVCGAPNVRKGQKVPVALVGTILYIDEEPVTIKRTRIRGVFSEGMICAEDELGLGTGHEGIMVLDENATVGAPASDYFNVVKEVIFEIGLTPNRIDGASHYGVARDLAAYLKLRGDAILSLPRVEPFKPDNREHPIEVIIENKEACPRYTGVTVSGIEIKESPLWLQNRLRSIGLSPINNIVDITNFVLHETGQPLHAFDADKIRGRKIVVRTLEEGSLFVTLDEVQRELSGEDLMICDAEDGMCIAGVFGGINSGVTHDTANVFLESAYFNPAYIRNTSKRFGLNTDASFRFERGTDPEMTLYALKRAALLIKELAGGKISSDIVDVYPKKLVPVQVRVFYSSFDRLIGKKIDPKTIKSILNYLDIKILVESDKGLSLEVPLYRVDVNREADIIEEVLRIYGYNEVEISDEVKSTLSYFDKPDKEKIFNMISDFLSSNGFFEIMVNSLTPNVYYKSNTDYPEEKTVKLLHPLSNELNAMRQSMLYGGLEVISYNINRKNPDLKLYEFGNCYSFDKNRKVAKPLDRYKEQEHLALFITGRKNERSWNSTDEHTNFFSLKSFTENILERLGFDQDKIELEDSLQEQFSEGIKYIQNNKTLVELGQVNRKLLTKFEIGQEVFYADFYWTEVLSSLKNHVIQINELPKFPEVKRDLSILIDKKIRYKQIKDIALKTEKKMLKRLSLFDVYAEEKIGKDKKSYAISFILQDEKKTLTDKQIDQVMNRLAKAFEDELGAKIR